MNDSLFKGWGVGKWLLNILILILTVYILSIFINITFAIGYIMMLAIHELGHVMAAKGYGASVSFGGFTPFGAYIQIMNETSMKENAVIAISGPMCGLLCTIIYYFIYYFLREQNFLWLSFFTAVVSVLNLLPLNPFDGGKVISGTFPYFPLLFFPFLAYGIYLTYEKQLWISGILVVLMVYIVIDVIRMNKEKQMEMLFQFEKSSKALIFTAYLLIVIVLVGLLGAMVFDYQGRLLPQLRQIQFPQDFIPQFLKQWFS